MTRAGNTKQFALYSRYVEDEDIVCETIDEDDTNRGQPGDERTMKNLQEIGNGIHLRIQLTVD